MNNIQESIYNKIKKTTKNSIEPEFLINGTEFSKLVKKYADSLDLVNTDGILFDENEENAHIVFCDCSETVSETPKKIRSLSYNLKIYPYSWHWSKKGEIALIDFGITIRWVDDEEEKDFEKTKIQIQININSQKSIDVKKSGCSYEVKQNSFFYNKKKGWVDCMDFLEKFSKNFNYLSPYEMSKESFRDCFFDADVNVLKLCRGILDKFKIFLDNKTIQGVIADFVPLEKRITEVKKYNLDDCVRNVMGVDVKKELKESMVRRIVNTSSKSLGKSADDLLVQEIDVEDFIDNMGEVVMSYKQPYQYNKRQQPYYFPKFEWEFITSWPNKFAYKCEKGRSMILCFDVSNSKKCNFRIKFEMVRLNWDYSAGLSKKLSKPRIVAYFNLGDGKRLFQYIRTPYGYKLVESPNGFRFGGKKELLEPNTKTFSMIEKDLRHFLENWKTMYKQYLKEDSDAVWKTLMEGFPSKQKGINESIIRKIRKVSGSDFEKSSDETITKISMEEFMRGIRETFDESEDYSKKNRYQTGDTIYFIFPDGENEKFRITHYFNYQTRNRDVKITNLNFTFKRIVSKKDSWTFSVEFCSENRIIVFSNKSLSLKDFCSIQKLGNGMESYEDYTIREKDLNRKFLYKFQKFIKELPSRCDEHFSDFLNNDQSDVVIEKITNMLSDGLNESLINKIKKTSPKDFEKKVDEEVFDFEFEDFMGLMNLMKTKLSGKYRNIQFPKYPFKKIPSSIVYNVRKSVVCKFPQKIEQEDYNADRTKLVFNLEMFQNGISYFEEKDLEDLNTPLGNLTVCLSIGIGAGKSIGAFFFKNIEFKKNGFEFQPFKERREWEKPNFSKKLACDFTKFASVLSKTIEEMPQEVWLEIGKESMSFFPIPGEACSKVDGDKVMRCLEDAGFFKKLNLYFEENLNESLVKKIKKGFDFDSEADDIVFDYEYNVKEIIKENGFENISDIVLTCADRVGNGYYVQQNVCKKQYRDPKIGETVNLCLGELILRNDVINCVWRKNDEGSIFHRIVLEENFKNLETSEQKKIYDFLVKKFENC